MFAALLMGRFAINLGGHRWTPGLARVLAPVTLAVILGKTPRVAHPNDTAVVVTTLLADRVCRLATLHANHRLGVFLVAALVAVGTVGRLGLVVVRTDRDRRMVPLIAAPVHALEAAVTIIIVAFLAVQSSRFATLDALHDARPPSRIHYRKSVSTQLNVALMQHMEAAKAVLLLVATLVNALIAKPCRFFFMAMHTQIRFVFTLLHRLQVQIWPGSNHPATVAVFHLRPIRHLDNVGGKEAG